MQLISGFVDTYLNLDETEEQIFRDELGKIEAEDKEQVMEIVTSWMRTGIEQGRKKWLQRESALIIRQLKRKIGQLTPDIEEQVKGLDIEELENLGEALLDFEQPEDLSDWLSNSSSSN